MEITRHLSHEELTSLLENGKDVSQHLEQCKDCGVDLHSLQRHLNVMPEAVRNATDLPHLFWQRQRAAIQSKIAVEEASRRSWAGLVWATVASLILLAGLLLNATKTAPKPQAQADPDQELLLAVEQAVDSNVPESLAPAALLAEDIRSAVESSPAPSSNHKEKSDED